MRIAPEAPDQPEMIALSAELDAYQESLDPPESRHPQDITALTQRNVVFAVACDVAGRAAPCVAMVLSPGFSEIKRMYVHPQHRSQGIAASLPAPFGKYSDDPLSVFMHKRIGEVSARR